MVLLQSENQPCAVLFVPVVTGLSALTPSAALLPLPRSSPGGVGVGVGVGVGWSFAWATGASAKQASTSGVKRRASREDDLPIDVFRCGTVILFLIFLGGLLNCI